MEFNEVIKRLGPKLKGIVHKLNTKFTYLDEEDLYQEAVIELWKKYQSGEISDKTDSYLLQGCMFFLKNYLRLSCKKIDRSSVHFTNDANGPLDTESVREEMIPDQKNSNFEFILVDIAIDEITGCLDKREKEVFLLSMEDLTTRQMGQRLGISHTMVVKIEKKIREKCEIFLKNTLPVRL